MLTSTVELFSEALNLGVTINTTDPDQLSYSFWAERSNNGKHRQVLEITEEAFHTDIVLPFYLACKKSLTYGTHEEFSTLLSRITGKKQNLSDSDLEDFRDLIDAICNIKQCHKNQDLPWND